MSKPAYVFTKPGGSELCSGLPWPCASTCSSLGRGQLPWLQSLAACRDRDPQGPLCCPPPHPLLTPACATSPALWARWLALTASIPLHHCRAPWPAGPTLSSTPGGLGSSPAPDPVWSWPSPLPSLDLSFLLLRIQFGSPAPCLLERPWGG